MEACKNAPKWLLKTTKGGITACSAHLGFVLDQCVQAGIVAGIQVVMIDDAGGYPCLWDDKPLRLQGIDIELKAVPSVAGVTPTPKAAATATPSVGVVKSVEKRPSVGVKPTLEVRK